MYHKCPNQHPPPFQTLHDTSPEAQRPSLFRLYFRVCWNIVLKVDFRDIKMYEPLPNLDFKMHITFWAQLGNTSNNVVNLKVEECLKYTSEAITQHSQILQIHLVHINVAWIAGNPLDLQLATPITGHAHVPIFWNYIETSDCNHHGSTSLYCMYNDTTIGS